MNIQQQVGVIRKISQSVKYNTEIKYNRSTITTDFKIYECITMAMQSALILNKIIETQKLMYFLTNTKVMLSVTTELRKLTTNYFQT